MGSEWVQLKQVRKGEWALFGPKGNQLSGLYRGPLYKALLWAKGWISGWYNWVVVYDPKGDQYNDDEQEN